MERSARRVLVGVLLVICSIASVVIPSPMAGAEDTDARLVEAITEETPSDGGVVKLDTVAAFDPAGGQALIDPESSSEEAFSYGGVDTTTNELLDVLRPEATTHGVDSIVRPVAPAPSPTSSGSVATSPPSEETPGPAEETSETVDPNESGSEGGPASAETTEAEPEGGSTEPSDEAAVDVCSGIVCDIMENPVGTICDLAGLTCGITDVPDPCEELLDCGEPLPDVDPCGLVGPNVYPCGPLPDPDLCTVSIPGVCEPLPDVDPCGLVGPNVYPCGPLPDPDLCTVSIPGVCEPLPDVDPCTVSLVCNPPDPCQLANDCQPPPIDPCTVSLVCNPPDPCQLANDCQPPPIDPCTVDLACEPPPDLDPCTIANDCQVPPVDPCAVNLICNPPPVPDPCELANDCEVPPIVVPPVGVPSIPPLTTEPCDAPEIATECDIATSAVDSVVDTLDGLASTCADAEVCAPGPVDCNDLLCQSPPTSDAETDTSVVVATPNDNPSPDHEDGNETLYGPGEQIFPAGCKFWAGGKLPNATVVAEHPLKWRTPVDQWGNSYSYIAFWIRAECDSFVEESGGRLTILGQRLRAFGYWQDRLEDTMELRENGDRSIRRDIHCDANSNEGTWTWRTRLILTYNTFSDGSHSVGSTSPEDSRYTCG